MIIRVRVIVRYTKIAKILISDIKMGPSQWPADDPGNIKSSRKLRVLLLINTEIIQSILNGPSIQKLLADVADVGSLSTTLLSLIFPLSIRLLCLILKECVTLLPEFSTSQMSEQNNLIPAQYVWAGEIHHVFCVNAREKDCNLQIH